MGLTNEQYVELRKAGADEDVIALVELYVSEAWRATYSEGWDRGYSEGWDEGWNERHALVQDQVQG